MAAVRRLSGDQHRCERETTDVTADAHEVYALDDAAKRLFRYFDKRKALDLVFVSDYGPKQIKWESPKGLGYNEAAWTGVLDRDANSVKVVRHERNETMTWSETCKPIQPMVSG